MYEYLQYVNYVRNVCMYLLVMYSLFSAFNHSSVELICNVVNTHASILSDTSNQPPQPPAVANRGEDGADPENEGGEVALSDHRVSTDEVLDYRFDCTGMFYWQPAVDLAEVTMVIEHYLSSHYNLL